MNTVLLRNILLIPLVISYEFPAKFTRCHLSDPDLDNCLNSAIENALRLIGTTGIASLNVPPIEPVETGDVEIGAGSNAVSLVQKYKDAKLYGYINAKVENTHFDVDKKVLTFTASMSQLVQKAKYEANGRILILPVYGAGDSTITLYDVDIVHKLKFREENRGGKQYFKIKSYKTLVNPKRIHFELENLFDGNKLLAENTLKVINENWQELFSDIRENLQETYAKVYKKMADKLFDQVPVEDIFLK